jgi:hypothetical protein
MITTSAITTAVHAKAVLGYFRVFKRKHFKAVCRSYFALMYMLWQMKPPSCVMFAGNVGVNFAPRQLLKNLIS